MDKQELLNRKIEEVYALEQKLRLKQGLPHLYGLTMYGWQKEFFESWEKMTLLCASNQSGKSSIQIRKAIHLATEKALWKRLFPHKADDPAYRPVIWYLYPNQDTVMQEFEEKWIVEFLPRGEFMTHPVYGWKKIIRNKVLKGVRFNSGVTIYFKTYSQNVSDLQAGTVASIFCFTAGHKVYCENGIKNIEDVTTSDRVLTRDGFKKVTRAASRAAEVIEKKTTAGVELTATHNHPFILREGIKEFDSLDKSSILWTIPIWRTLWTYWQTKNLSYLKESFTLAIRKVKTLGRETISEAEIPRYILQCGKATMVEKSLMAALFITRTLILSTIGLRTLSYYHVQSILEFIRSRSGKLWSISHSLVRSAASSSLVAQARGLYRDIVLRSAEGLRRLLPACIVEKKKKLDQMLGECIALQHAQTEIKDGEIVYGLEVEDNNEYYCNGILVHNCDEELPESLYPELNARLFATDGFFSMAFTATLGQEFWRLAIEPREDEVRKFPSAKVMQITMYDCMFYHDGTKTHITKESIQRKIDSCSSKAEVRRRIFGRFVKDSGLKYFGFTREKNYVPYPVKNGASFTGVPTGWRVYSGVDIGSGGEKNHPSAYAFVSANGDFTKLRVFLGKRLDGIETTAGDVYSHYKSTRGKLRCTQQSYDWACKDFGTITERAHDYFVKAEKGHDKGEEILNTAFKLGILQIYQCPEHDKLVGEIESLLQTTDKRHAKDDFIDAIRYAIASIPVNWAEIFENVRKNKVVKIDCENMEQELRPNDYKNEDFVSNNDELLSGYEDEFDEYNELY